MTPDIRLRILPPGSTLALEFFSFDKRLRYYYFQYELEQNMLSNLCVIAPYRLMYFN